MKKTYSAVIFDLDGTLLNTLDDLADGVNYAMAEAGCPLRTVEEVRSFVGNGILKLIERALPPERRSGEEVAKTLSVFTAYYSVHCAEKTAPYRGIAELVADLHAKGIPMSVFSNKDEGVTAALCRRFFGDVFAAVIGGRADLPKKPAPNGALFALQAMGVEREKVLYVGDSDVDILTARNACLDCAAVTWGFRPRALLEGLHPEYIVDDVQTLRAEFLAFPLPPCHCEGA
jgi:phosphoglycolate phosphatase